MKKTIVLAVSAFAVANVAHAADLAVKAPVYKAPVVAPFSWTGLYVGVQGGGGWGRQTWLDNSILGSTDFRASGGFFGGQAGYRYQLGQFVFGVEAAGAPADLKDTNSAGPTSETFKVQSLYSATGQVGFALDRWLPYVKGGWGGAQTNLFAQNTAIPVSASHSENNSGWVVGGGLDYAITNNIILGVEYNHYDLDFQDFTAPAGNGSLIVTNSSRLKVDAVLGRFNFKF